MDVNEPGISHNAAFNMALRHLLYRSRAGALWAFSDSANEVLLSLWSDAAAIVEEPDRQEPQGLEARRLYTYRDYSVRIIRCSSPHDIGDSHFVAVACKRGRPHILPWKRQPGEVRYLALEVGLDLNGLRTVLGEWTAAGHINYSTGPEPTEDAFATALIRILDGDLAPVATYLSPRGA